MFFYIKLQNIWLVVNGKLQSSFFLFLSYFNLVPHRYKNAVGKWFTKMLGCYCCGCYVL